MIDLEKVTDSDGARERGGGGSDKKSGQEEERSLDMQSYVRDDILQTVDECLTAWEKGNTSAAAKASDVLQRCIVCTLPHGTCKHNKQWLDNRHLHSILDPLPIDRVEETMDDISDVLTPAPVARVTVEPDDGAPSFSHIHWETLSPQPTRELLDWKVDVSTPCSRAGHTMVLLNGPGSFTEDTRLLVVFGGVSSTEQTGNHDWLNAPSEDEQGGLPLRTMSYITDVWLFRVSHRTWYCPHITGELPRGRYGHVSLALDSELMWMFGGRLEGGSQGGDTFVLNVREMKWERTNVEGGAGTTPSPRVWSAAARIGERVLLFGGADLQRGRIFDDVWIWNTENRYWEEQIVIGNPPLARYGHALLACPDGKVFVLGGCCVSTSAEDGLPTDHDKLKLQVRVAANRVTRAYQLEEAETAFKAIDNYRELGSSMQDFGQLRRKSFPALYSRSNGHILAQKICKDLPRHQAQLAAAVAARERETALREEELRTTLHEQAAMTYWAKLHSRNPFKKMDATFLDTENLIWGETNPLSFGQSRSSSPAARMHFSAVLLHKKVVVWGGCFPTSRRMEVIDEGVHVFDLVHRRWGKLFGQEQREGIKPRLDSALGQLRRAERALFDAKQTAMTIGAPRGRTLQVVQAEAAISVNRWRVRKIEEELRQAVPLAPPRAAHAGCIVGHRVIYYGGWGAQTERGELLVLDIEDPREKGRRLDEEFHQRLERERQEREATEVGALRRAVVLKRMTGEQELTRAAAETAMMATEDARSTHLELTIAPTPRLCYANSTTIWIEWDQTTVDCLGNPIDEPIEYILYMRGGFSEWKMGDNVLVEYLSKAQRSGPESFLSTETSFMDIGSLNGALPSLGKKGRNSSETTPAGNDRKIQDASGVDMIGSNNGRDEERAPQPLDTRRHFPAVISRNSTNGLFDIRWANGECEGGVRRHRIHPSASSILPWAIIYRGVECRYAVEGMVPDYVIQRKGGYCYEVGADFSLQTKGAEMPRHKLSGHSPVVSFRTKFAGQGPVNDGKIPADETTLSGVKARLVSAKVLDESVEASRVDDISTASTLHALHGQYLGKGRGRPYL